MFLTTDKWDWFQKSLNVIVIWELFMIFTTPFYNFTVWQFLDKIILYEFIESHNLNQRQWIEVWMVFA